MNFMYEKMVTPREGLRLHLNENTGGCSPAVLAAIHGITAEDAAYYPDYSEAIGACAAYLGLPVERVLLTNGLDEGILSVCISSLKGSTPDAPLEAIVIVPAFDMFASSADGVGGRVIEVPMDEDFAFPLERTLRAITDRTRLVFITDPNNPTGLSAPADAIFEIAAAAPQATIFVDEAYAEIRGRTTIGDLRLERHPNVVIGRTFAKAQGLAAIRIGALTGDEGTLQRIRRVVPPYSINIAAAVALPAALRDRAFTDRYVAEARASKARLYAALDRLGITYWPSDANFVLARFGPRTPDVVAGLLAREIYVRDRSKAPLCTGCVRITTGMIAHTDRAIAAIEEVLCAAR
jgi:histidinol-phosphate aminotransferase